MDQREILPEPDIENVRVLIRTQPEDKSCSVYFLPLVPYLKDTIFSRDDDEARQTCKDTFTSLLQRHEGNRWRVV